MVERSDAAVNRREVVSKLPVIMRRVDAARTSRTSPLLWRGLAAVVEVIGGCCNVVGVTSFNRPRHCRYVIHVIDNGVGMRASSISRSGLEKRRAVISLPLVAFPLAMTKC
jgi:hypothetical protein